MIVSFLPSFLKKCRKFPEDLQNEIDEKISLFRSDPLHPFLKIHKLHGMFKNSWSFSVNYRYRIIFQYLSKDEVILLAIGDHEIYKQNQI